MTKVDVSLAKETYAKEIAQLIDEYGDASSVPADDQRLASEKLRAAYCIDTNPDVPVAQVFKTYSIDSRVWGHFVENADDMKLERKLTRADKQAKVLEWASKNVGAKIELTKLMEVGDIAYSMAKKITENRPDVFWKIKRGQFEVRDPEADRKADKDAAKKAEPEN
jgi:hypothetical protein